MDPTPFAPPSRRPPPRIHSILKFLRLRKAGVSVAEAPWQQYKLQNAEFDELQRWLKQDEDLWSYVETKVRYDYDSEKASLVSRKPTTLHASFITFVAFEISNRIRDIEENGDLESSTFARKIHSMGSARLDLLGSEDQAGKPKMRRDPDLSFKHTEAQWSGVVLELSYPSKRRALPHLADDYILETNGSIRMLVGFDLDTDTKKATISTWQPSYKRNEQGTITEIEAALVRDAEMFRDKYGNANKDPDSGLHLDLEDFAPPDLTIDLTDEVPIFISSATLCLLLARAEAAQLNTDESQGGVPYKPRKLRIKKRGREEFEPDSGTSDSNTLEENSTEEASTMIEDANMDEANITTNHNSSSIEEAVSPMETEPGTPDPH